jgi:hypothetical protein
MPAFKYYRTLWQDVDGRALADLPDTERTPVIGESVLYKKDGRLMSAEVVNKTHDYGFTVDNTYVTKVFLGEPTIVQ